MATPKDSAGILLWREGDQGVEVLLVHPGGPFWARKDEGAWSIPKGEIEPGDDALDTAKREFAEETGCEPVGEPTPLGSVRMKSGKTVHAWALLGDFDLAAFRSNSFTMEWPPGSGRTQSFPECDRAEWFDPETARRKLNPAQAALIDRLPSRGQP